MFKTVFEELLPARRMLDDCAATKKQRSVHTTQSRARVLRPLFSSARKCFEPTAMQFRYDDDDDDDDEEEEYDHLFVVEQTV